MRRGYEKEENRFLPLAVADDPSNPWTRRSMIETKIPGLKVTEQIITLECRVGRGNDGAFDEAVIRARRVYDTMKGHPANADATYHLVLTVDRPDSTIPTTPAPCPWCGEKTRTRFDGNVMEHLDGVDKYCPSSKPE